jgi:lipopolysaccharide/colanic/teichoic acid biosynthesis glycosyltransferase
VKRIIDLLLASLMLSISSPAWLLIAIAIRLNDGGPVFFRQKRWGRGGTEFQLIKFRTMKLDVGSLPSPASESDPRVTRPGRFLRRTGLDELPQMLNILKGEMSFVGPRALAVGEEVRLIDGSTTTYETVPGFEARLEVTPGLTGTTTIYLPKDAPVEEKFRSDLQYVASRSLFFDLRLIALSFGISFRGRWEDRKPKI